jgi:hypothetical protein
MDIETHEIMSQALVERGVMTAEQVALDRIALETQLAGSVSPTAEPDAPTAPVEANAQTDLPTVPVDPIDAMVFAGPDSPQSYQFDPPPPGLVSDLNQEREIRQFFHAEGVPVSIAKEVNRLYGEGLLNPPNEQQLEQSRQSCMATLTKVWGSDRDKNIAVAQREVTRMAQTKPEIREMLDVTGLGNNPWLLQTLVTMAKAKGRA